MIGEVVRPSDLRRVRRGASCSRCPIDIRARLAVQHTGASSVLAPPSGISGWADVVERAGLLARIRQGNSGECGQAALLLITLRERLNKQAAADILDVLEAADLTLAHEGLAHRRPDREAVGTLKQFALVDDQAAVDLARFVVLGDVLLEIVGTARVLGRRNTRCLPW
jgi:hypothetical protein